MYLIIWVNGHYITLVNLNGNIINLLRHNIAIRSSLEAEIGQTFIMLIISTSIIWIKREKGFSASSVGIME